MAVEPGRSLNVARGLPGPPKVLFDAGAFGIYVDGANVLRALARLGVPAASYTRAGLSGSDPAPWLPTPDRHAQDMLGLLRALGQDRAVVLVGHSMAAFRLHRLAAIAPERVRGLVLVDAMVPEAWPMPALRAFAGALRPVERVLPAFCRTASAYPNAMRLDGGERADKLTSVYSADHLRATRSEIAAVARTRIASARGVPMVLMPAGRIARGSGALAARAGARLVDMSAWGHASVLSPEPSRLIAEAAAELSE